jgi:hypothetical protein
MRRPFKVDCVQSPERGRTSPCLDDSDQSLDKLRNCTLQFADGDADKSPTCHPDPPYISSIQSNLI